MEHLPIDYSKTIMYKLVCRDLSVKELYCGATTNWDNRKGTHKNRCTNENNNKYHYKVYQYIRANGGWDNWNMILVEVYPCKTQLESLTRERYWTDTLDAKLNTNIQGQTKQEWTEKNKEQVANLKKKWYEKNREEILEKQKDYHIIHKEKINKRSNDFYNNNKKEQLEKMKVKYEKNKEQILEKLKEKYTCECGQISTISHKLRHNKSKKHINFIQANGATALPLG